ncbi:MAG TPA: hypothetical protein VGO00_05650 [Kofleriaceae bacterium]|nr:hypothetical protein [Kofleriaceae bacterium]
MSHTDDAELAAAPEATGTDVTPAIAALCKLAFRVLRPLSQDEATKQLGGSTDARPPAAVPTVSIGQPVVNGDLDKAVVRRYIKRQVHDIQTCYTHVLATKPSLSGTVSAIKAIEFPKPKAGAVQVNFPFTFRPGA